MMGTRINGWAAGGEGFESRSRNSTLLPVKSQRYVPEGVEVLKRRVEFVLVGSDVK